MKIKDWQKKAVLNLNKAGIDSSELDSIIMLEAVLSKERSSIRAHDDDELAPSHLNQLESMLKRRTAREPLAYIIGMREFYGLEFSVSKDVLVPRPETEILAEHAIASIAQGGSVLELGTGSGAIAVALKSYRQDLSITATDISPEALAMAKANARRLMQTVSFLESNLFENVTGTYDAVLANLPYVPVPARRQPEITFEPDVALYGGEDGLDFYRTFFAHLATHLKPGAFAIVEFSPTQYADVRNEFSDFTFKPLSEYIYVCQPAKS